MKVLVIDDDPDIVELVSVCINIRWMEAQTVGAGEGWKGLSLLETENPDLVILDIGLPDLNGHEVLKRLRESSDVPVLVLTGVSRDVDIATLLRAGADDYVVKPFSQIELIARIEALLRRAAGRIRLPGEETPPGLPKAYIEGEDTHEGTHEGTVHLRVQAGGDMRRVVNFVQQLRAVPDFRILRLANNLIGGVDLTIVLRQPAPLQHMLGAMDGVADVSSTESLDVSSADDDSHLMVTLT